MLAVLSFLCTQLNVNVVGYDYSGYGASEAPGPPLEHWTYRDIAAVYGWCVETKLVRQPEKEIVLYGQVTKMSYLV